MDNIGNSHKAVFDEERWKMDGGDEEKAGGSEAGRRK